MEILDIFEAKRKNLFVLSKLRRPSTEATVTCPTCNTDINANVLADRHYICPECGFYMPMTPEQRIDMIADEGTFKQLYAKLKTKDPISFPGYSKKLAKSKAVTDSNDAVVTGICKIGGSKAAIGIMDSRFLMGSMGTVVGEKVSRLFEYADKKRLPVILFCASGGARMQEGLFSLMQMAKTSAACEKFKQNQGLFISCLTNPTTGGVSASFANLGNIIMAEPNALICFAGPRVIEQTIGQKLPYGFQRSEFLEEHGMIDMIVERHNMKDVLHRILVMHGK